MYVGYMCVGVMKATYNGQNVAVKTLKDGSKDAQEFLAEASVMTYVSQCNSLTTCLSNWPVLFVCLLASRSPLANTCAISL